MTSVAADDEATFRITALTSQHKSLLETVEGIAHSGATPAELKEALGAADACVLGALTGAVDAPQLMGFILLARQPFDAEIQAVGVLPERRGQGVGDALMRAAQRMAERFHSERLLLEVRAGNAAAIALYQRHGFSVDGRRNHYYPAASASDAGREDALLMSLPLAAGEAQ
ncbi:GNAT family N-acetyltransferase [Vreelandella subglaciescola]|jgi:ribosomal-protein-alanine N-acetyltransferase|uniref:Ribosomal-protein-alanine N-acetyltransferase n=1 Tax=Vreelandella subglaciescola TaxID=29571 RepID=A0A1M7G8G7_9GAMM|nr:GNAT family N-acetyltransferase [Halomonas subglaciescola]SHM12476.1 ribosomal-protein-alanine N-acetyltransferase [Halomonas subglaciescola]